MARELARREGGLSPFGERFDAFEPFEMLRNMSRWDPFRELERMARALPATERFMPSFDVKETPEAYEILADLPGLSEDDVDVSLSGNLLTISGKREQEEKKQDDTWYTVERSYGSFSRSFTLPEDIDEEHCDASFENGVLTVRLHKSEEEQPRRIKLFGRSKEKQQGKKDAGRMEQGKSEQAKSTRGKNGGAEKNA